MSSHYPESPTLLELHCAHNTPSRWTHHLGKIDSPLDCSFWQCSLVNLSKLCMRGDAITSTAVERQFHFLISDQRVWQREKAVKTFISCYRTPGPWNWLVSPGKPNASSISTPFWRVLGVLKGFWRVLRLTDTRTLQKPFRDPFKNPSDPLRNPWGTLQGSGGSVAGMKVLTIWISGPTTSKTEHAGASKAHFSFLTGSQLSQTQYPFLLGV